ncbi:N-formylglutamate deformylase [Vibrio viridaestus]|uniref:N-formylglutamate deformylase n=1 Tax=Vibrio viridaestus TaxID=2487322 RepID=A0A3N9TGB3_9VIBR|nr:N-formylglutamate deformylase [Vibrio viridaestus]RQW63308.1 N-formylglutamate deformylase [Vibrio viridaestus]
MNSYHYIPGSIPLLISIPHAGTQLTEEVAAGLTDSAKHLPDTDWHVEKLYQFALDMGAHMIVADYSRFVVDLNRPADDQPLYTTATTGLFPSTLFNGVETYQKGKEPNQEHRSMCLEQVWHPYHKKLQDVLMQLKAEFGYAVLFDAHSIASNIPRLFDGQLPDLNLGTNSGQSCSPSVEKTLQTILEKTDYTWVINGRFKGGYITRAYGQPDQHIHALQLELAQINYMDEKPPFEWREDKASHLITVLEDIVTQYYSTITTLY